MQVQLTYTDNTVELCKACYGHHWVEKLTGSHGPVLDARNQEGCSYCAQRTSWEHENQQAREHAIHVAESKADAEEEPKEVPPIDKKALARLSRILRALEPLRGLASIGDIEEDVIHQIEIRAACDAFGNNVGCNADWMDNAWCLCPSADANRTHGAVYLMIIESENTFAVVQHLEDAEGNMCPEDMFVGDGEDFFDFLDNLAEAQPDFKAATTSIESAF